MSLSLTADYHLHSSVSPDCQFPMEQMCRAAIQRGLTQLAFTEHFEFYTPGFQGYPFDRPYLEEYFRQLHRCREQFQGQLTLLSAIEIGQPTCNPSQSRRMLQGFSFDYRIGSVHKICDRDLGLYDYHTTDLNWLKAQNLALLLELAQDGGFDCLGHLDLVKRYGARQGVSVRMDEERELFSQIFSHLIRQGKGIELNTSGLRQEAKEAMPSLALLRLYRQQGGEIVTVGSDAHRPQDVGADFALARELLLQAGFCYVAHYRQGQPEFVRL